MRDHSTDQITMIQQGNTLEIYSPPHKGANQELRSLLSNFQMHAVTKQDTVDPTRNVFSHYEVTIPDNPQQAEQLDRALDRVVPIASEMIAVTQSHIKGAASVIESLAENKLQSGMVANYVKTTGNLTLRGSPDDPAMTNALKDAGFKWHKAFTPPGQAEIAGYWHAPVPADHAGNMTANVRSLDAKAQDINRTLGTPDGIRSTTDKIVVSRVVDPATNQNLIVVQQSKDWRANKALTNAGMEFSNTHKGYVAPVSTQTDYKGIAEAITANTRHFEQYCLIKPVGIEKPGVPPLSKLAAETFKTMTPNDYAKDPKLRETVDRFLGDLNKSITYPELQDLKAGKENMRFAGTTPDALNYVANLVGAAEHAQGKGMEVMKAAEAGIAKYAEHTR